MAGETRQKILEVTERLIQMRGLARVTTREIARATGLSEGALYRHFEHKEEIFMAVVSEHLPAVVEVLQAHEAGSGTVTENLAAIAVAMMRYYGHHFPLSAAYLADTELLTRYREVIQKVRGGPHNVFNLIAAYVEEEQQLGRIGREIPALTIATLLLGPCFQRVFIAQLLGYDPFGKTDQQFADELVQALMISIVPA